MRGSEALFRKFPSITEVEIMRKMFLWSLKLSSVLIQSLALAQSGREPRLLYNSEGKYEPVGWYVGAGICKMIPRPAREDLTGYNEQDDTLFSGSYERNGGVGIFLEAGRHHFFRQSAICNHADYGLTYHAAKGSENFSGVPNCSASMFNVKYLGITGHLTRNAPLSDRVWFHLGLGLRCEAGIIRRNSQGAFYGVNFKQPHFLHGQSTLRIGMGWKPEPGIYLVPSLEFSILNVFPFEGAVGTLPFFNGRFRPVFISLRVMWLNGKKNRVCEGQPGTDPNLEKEYKREKSNLWGPEMRGKKK